MIELIDDIIYHLRFAKLYCAFVRWSVERPDSLKRESDVKLKLRGCGAQTLMRVETRAYSREPEAGRVMNTTSSHEFEYDY